uniref:C2H2-type domain-containing protein n=1 Tax=viral metagenome TaxID=1070528 RepID=A0A6C0EAY4_9ZZZZ
MPKTDIDYSNTIIYKIMCKDTNIKDVYVGHTTNFVQRKHAHKQNCTNMKSINYSCKLYQAIRNNGGWNNWNMEIVGFFNCKDHYEARIKEQEYFELLHATLNSIEPMPKPKQKFKIEKSEPTEKIIYNCEICKVKLQNLKCMEIHNQTSKHIKKQKLFVENNTMVEQKMYDNTESNTHAYNCNLCDYHTSKKSDLKKHLITPKHIKNKNNRERDLEIDGNEKTATNICDICSKQFLTNSGLWKHKKKCLFINNEEPNNSQNTLLSNVLTPKMFLDILNQSKELQNVLVEQTKELQAKLLEQSHQLLEQNKQIIELAKKPSMVNSNNQFNLNFFLNETCKNAMNIQDFIQSIKLTTQDFENTGRLGFVDGISRIFINELKRLEVERRPLHCTDMKRETVYVKDNDTWEKENQEKKKLKWAIHSIAQLNLNQVQQWQQEYPECRENNTIANTRFNEMAMVALGGFGDEEVKKFDDKIMKNVMREIVVAKDM